MSEAIKVLNKIKKSADELLKVRDDNLYKLYSINVDLDGVRVNVRTDVFCEAAAGHDITYSESEGLRSHLHLYTDYDGMILTTVINIEDLIENVFDLDEGLMNEFIKIFGEFGETIHLTDRSFQELASGATYTQPLGDKTRVVGMYKGQVIDTIIPFGMSEDEE